MVYVDGIGHCGHPLCYLFFLECKQSQRTRSRFKKIKSQKKSGRHRKFTLSMERERKESLLNKVIPLIDQLHSLFAQLQPLCNVECFSPPTSTLRQLDFINSNKDLIQAIGIARTVSSSSAKEDRIPPSDTFSSIPNEESSKPPADPTSSITLEFTARWDYEDDDKDILSFKVGIKLQF